MNAVLQGQNLENEQSVSQVGPRVPVAILRPAHKWSIEDGRAPKRSLSGYMIYVRERKYDLMM
jgi:hypothetical protein